METGIISDTGLIDVYKRQYLYYGNYPLARPIYVLLNDPRNALPWGFASFLTSDRGQRIILKSGLDVYKRQGLTE